LAHRTGSRPSKRKYHVGTKVNQLGCQCRQARYSLDITKAKVDANVAPIGPAQFLQPLHELPDQALDLWVPLRDRKEKTDTPHTVILLRARRDRPCSSRTPKKRDEFPPLHVPLRLKTRHRTGSN
jgi:hypothetical protein